MRPELGEIARYLGYGNRPLDGASARLAEECLAQLEGACTPRQVYRRMGREALPFSSGDLDRHLAGCREVFLFAATLGAPADALLRRWAAQDMARAAVGQACAAAWLESYCDECCQGLAARLEPGLFLRSRYSPGYGDLPLSCQRPLLELLDAGRRLGLSLTQGDMLVPAKSVTAVLGVAREEGSCHLHKCAACPSATCPFRKV